MGLLSKETFVQGDYCPSTNEYLTDSGVPIEKKHVKGGGLLYGGHFQILYLQIKLFAVIVVPIEKKYIKGGLLYGCLS